jgi:predicted solute-binding protein
MEPTLLGVQASEDLRTLEQASSEAAEEVQALEAFLRTLQAYLWQLRHHLGVKEEHQLERESGEGKEEAPPHPLSKLREKEEESPLTILLDHK